jgi:RNA polymerase sigma-70 factor (ECF subfamily)
VEEITGVWDRVAADEAAALALYPMLRRFAAVVAPREVAPDDLVQDALVATLRQGPLASLDDPGAYLRRVMLNQAANHRRRFARARRAIGRWRAGSSDRVEDAYPSDLADLAALSPLERAVLFLHEVEAVPYDAISAQLGIPAATARQIATRARRRLRTHLEEQ